MVFPGRFSTGCMRCRQRKVKCDETKPSCRRCYIYGKPCPGYTDQFHFRRGLNSANFANTSPKSATSASTTSPPQLLPQTQTPSYGFAQLQQRRASNGSEETNTDPNWNSQLVTQPYRPHMQPPSILPNPDISYDQVSLCYFVRRFVSPDGADMYPGHLTFLPNLFNHYGHGILETATLSVAQMAAYNQFGGEKFKVESYRNYGRAIGFLQESIKSEQATDDRVLTAILLLCTFKDISGEGGGDPSDHAAGIYYILEKRGFEQLATRRGFELFILALLRLHVYSFLHDDDTYSDPGGLTQFLGLFDPLMRAMSMVQKTLQLRHILAKSGIQQHPGQDGSSFSEQSDFDEEIDAPLIRECFEYLDEFTAWDSEAAKYWKLNFEDRVFPATLGEPATGVGHYDPETACTIILVRCSRLILLMSMLEYRDRMQLVTGGAYGLVGIGAQWADFVSTLEHDIRSTIDDMLYCVPYALGDLDPKGRHTSAAYDGAGALVIVQPMRLVTFCRHATRQQEQAAQRILSRINTTMGIKSAIPWMGEEVCFGFTSAAGRDRFTTGRAMSIASTEMVSPVPSPITSGIVKFESPDPRYL